jgi:hypothetical protein
MHRFPCPNCGKTLKIDDAMLADAHRRGKGMHCPTCKTPVRVGDPILSPRRGDSQEPETNRATFRAVKIDTLYRDV